MVSSTFATPGHTEPIALPDGVTVEQTIRTHQLKITAAWQKQVSSIIETGQLLIKAKDGLEHGQWGKLFEGDDKLPFGQDTASKLMKVARHPVLSNSEFTLNLPPSWFTLYVLTQLPQQQLERHLADGTINAETTQDEAIALVRPRPAAVTQSVEQRDIERLENAAEIPRRIAFEPPWKDDDSKDRIVRHFLEHRFLLAGAIAEKFEDAETYFGKGGQFFRWVEAVVATNTVADEDGDIVADDGPSLLREDA